MGTLQHCSTSVATCQGYIAFQVNFTHSPNVNGSKYKDTLQNTLTSPGPQEELCLKRTGFPLMGGHLGVKYLVINHCV